MTRYDEIMERVEVTPEMRERVLANATEVAAKPVTRRNPWKSCLAIAACLVLVLLGSLTLPRLLSRPATPVPTEGDLQQGGWEITEYGSVEALSEAAGFAVQDVPALADARKTCALISGELAQIDYTTADTAITYRVSPGSGDNSGDYHAYSAVESREIGGVPVTFKGDGASCSLALWEAGGRAYSLSCFAGIPYDAMESYVRSVLLP